MNAVLQFDGVERSYRKGVPVLTGVTFPVEPGEVVGLLGRNGSGKTTLIRIAMGMLHPQAGAVRVFGLSPFENAVEVKRRIGYAAEDQVLPGHSTIAQMTAFHRYLFPQWDTAWERQLLERFSLDPAARIGKLSKGQARQVALLCAICHRPELLILDEPGGGLDPAARREFLEASIQLLNREGCSILFSSHHMSDVERIGGRMVLLDGGRVFLDRPLDTLRESLCVALVPKTSAVDSAAIERVPGCLRARSSGEDWHAVFEGEPDAVSRELAASLGADGIRCVQVPLEELFVELLGGQR